MKKALAAAAAIIGALYLVLCFTVYIPKNGFKEMLSSIVPSSLFILVGVAILLIEFLCDGDRKPSLDGKTKSIPFYKDNTRISCPSIHGVFSIQEKRDGEYYCKSIHVSGDAPQAVFEVAQLCGDVRSKTKYRDTITEVRR